MPWCPKCETEYREGISVCVDCGSVLVEELSDKNETKNEFEEEINSFELLKDMSEEEVAEFFEESKKDAMERRKQLEEGPGVYVESSKKAQEFKSGAFSLLLVGGLGLIAVLLIIFEIIPLQMNLFSKYLVLGVMGTLFVLFFIMGIFSIKSYKKFELKATEEDHLTDNLKEWCKENLTKDIIDEGIEESKEELQYFQRTEKMKELISEKFMNLDAAFLESFVDDIYQNIFE